MMKLIILLTILCTAIAHSEERPIEKIAYDWGIGVHFLPLPEEIADAYRVTIVFERGGKRYLREQIEPRRWQNHWHTAFAMVGKVERVVIVRITPIIWQTIESVDEVN